MIDLAAPKVAVPATVFMVVTALGQSPLLVPIITWIIIKFMLRLSITRADIVTWTVLASALSVPVLSYDHSLQIVIKGLLFLFIFAYLRIALPFYY